MFSRMFDFSSFWDFGIDWFYTVIQFKLFFYCFVELLTTDAFICWHWLSDSTKKRSKQEEEKQKDNSAVDHRPIIQPAHTHERQSCDDDQHLRHRHSQQRSVQKQKESEAEQVDRELITVSEEEEEDDDDDDDDEDDDDDDDDDDKGWKVAHSDSHVGAFSGTSGGPQFTTSPRKLRRFK